MEENEEKNRKLEEATKEKAPYADGRRQAAESRGETALAGAGRGAWASQKRANGGELADHLKAKGSPQCPWDSICV